MQLLLFWLCCSSASSVESTLTQNHDEEDLWEFDFMGTPEEVREEDLVANSQESFPEMEAEAVKAENASQNRKGNIHCPDPMDGFKGIPIDFGSILDEREETQGNEDEGAGLSNRNDQIAKDERGGKGQNMKFDMTANNSVKGISIDIGFHNKSESGGAKNGKGHMSVDIKIKTGQTKPKELQSRANKGPFYGPSILRGKERKIERHKSQHRRYKQELRRQAMLEARAKAAAATMRFKLAKEERERKAKAGQETDAPSRPSEETPNDDQARWGGLDLNWARKSSERKPDNSAQGRWGGLDLAWKARKSHQSPTETNDEDEKKRNRGLEGPEPSKHASASDHHEESNINTHSPNDQAEGDKPSEGRWGGLDLSWARKDASAQGRWGGLDLNWARKGDKHHPDGAERSKDATDVQGRWGGLDLNWARKGDKPHPDGDEEAKDSTLQGRWGGLDLSWARKGHRPDGAKHATKDEAHAQGRWGGLDLNWARKGGKPNPEGDQGSTDVQGRWGGLDLNWQRRQDEEEKSGEEGETQGRWGGLDLNWARKQMAVAKEGKTNKQQNKQSAEYHQYQREESEKPPNGEAGSDYGGIHGRIAWGGLDLSQKDE